MKNISQIKSICLDEGLSFHHIGVITGDLDIISNFYTGIGFEFGEVIYDPIQKVYLRFGRDDKGLLIELVKPETESRAFKILKNNNSGPYHLCFQTNNYPLISQMLKENKFFCLQRRVPAIAFGDKLVSFFYNKDVGLIEILEI